MSVKPVQQQQGFFQGTVYPCMEKIYETIKSIANYILKTLKTIFCCRSSTNEKGTLAVTKVSDITSEQIQDLAEHIGSHVMKELNVGIVRRVEIPNATLLSGKTPTVIIYDPNDPLLQKMKPLIADQLRNAFAKGEKEVALLIRRVNSTQGILPTDTRMNKELSNKERWIIHLQLNEKGAKKSKELCFTLTNLFLWENNSSTDLIRTHFSIHDVSDAVRKQYIASSLVHYAECERCGTAK